MVKKDKRTSQEKARDTKYQRYGPDYFRNLGKKGGGNPILAGIKNGTLKVVPVK